MNKPYTQILTKISRSAKLLILNDIKLMTLEVKNLAKDLKGHTRKIAVFGFLFAASSVPLMIFSILALGDLLNGQYWLSSLIIGVVLFVIGYLGSTYAYRKIKKLDFKLSKTTAAIQKEGQIISREFKKLTDITNETLQKEDQRAAN